MDKRRHDIELILLEALEKKSSEERAVYIDQVCGDDKKARAELDSLLESYGQAGDFLETPPIEQGLSLDESPLSEGPGAVIGRYKLLEKIGEGGMAVVYMAEQQEPIHRKVALKIIKLGMDTKSVIARFEAERQALAMMDHPNIAKVLDAGATETGRPYFVMELVTGVSITEYCDKNNLSTQDRLTLFIKVCNAVQHAHQKGIIHRDIKPSNVMVTQRDGTPIPKIIDFGIAKAINQRLTEKTLFTRYAHIIGTPAYMSPEQAELSDLDIDTRTDIYSLGVLLYELLTGTPPFSEEELHKAGYLEMQRIIREEEPTKPSTKLSTLGKTLTDVAKSRQSTPDLLRKAIRGDLDWIVMKSLEKERTRRYETAHAMSTDILHHLQQEPISARPPVIAYVLSKYLRKHKLKIATTVTLTILLTAVVIISLMWNQNRARLMRSASLADKAILSQAREAFAKNDLVAALKDAKSIINSKHVGPEAKLLYAGIMVEGSRPEEAISTLEGLLKEKREIAGTAHALLARVYWEGKLGESKKLQKVAEHRQKAETLLPETAEAYYLQAMTALTIKEKLNLLDEALHLDPAHYESCRLRAFTYYASRKYEKMRDDALVMVALRPNDPLGYSLRAMALRELGRYEQAIEDYKSAIRFTPERDVRRTNWYDECCESYLRMGDNKGAIAQARECLKSFPGESVIHIRNFCALTALGDYKEASKYYQQNIESSPEAHSSFIDWSMKYIFDTLDVDRTWHPPGSEPQGVAFLPMQEAEQLYDHLSARAHRVIADAFTARWSPDGTKLAFSLGFHGYSGVAIYDIDAKETNLLFVPGKDPAWSPDGRYIAFVRDCQSLTFSELVGAERENRLRNVTREEVWIINSDGTEPKRLASGGWPSWSSDSNHVYYQSRTDKMLYRKSIEDTETPPQPILDCPSQYPYVSPDEVYVAYSARQSLKIVDIASKSLVAQWPIPLDQSIWGVGGWSSHSSEITLQTFQFDGRRSGLWIYDLDKRQGFKVLDGWITAASWSLDQTKLVFNLGPPYYEIWAADVDSTKRTIDTLGPARNLDGHYQDMVGYYTRRIEVDPTNTGNYFLRAKYHEYLHDINRCRADMASYTILSKQSREPFGWQFGTPENLGPVINTQAEELQPLPSTDGLSLFFKRRNAEGYLEYWLATREMKDHSWKTTERFTSLRSETILAGVTTADGLEFYFYASGEHGASDIFVRKRATINDDWGQPINLGNVVNSPATEMSPAISPDGLELYFSDFYNAVRPGGCGQEDLWVTKRTTRDDPWTKPVNLGSPFNGADMDSRPSLSADGLILLFDSVRPGGIGSSDIYMSRRVRIDAPWEEPVNLGPSVNTPAAEYFPHLSADGTILYWDSHRPGGCGNFDIWQVPILREDNYVLTDLKVQMAEKQAD